MANLFKYNQFLAGLGTSYQPTLASIRLDAMLALQVEAQGAIDTVKTLHNVWKTETNNREIHFSGLSTFCSRLLGMLRSTDVSQQTIDDMTFLVAKLRSKTRKTAKPKTTETDPAASDNNSQQNNTRSRSRMSFNMRLDTFSQIIILLKRVLDYKPAEPEVAVQGLDLFLQRLTKANELSTMAEANLRRARINRDKILYEPDTGLLSRVKQSKAYVLGLYGKGSAQFKHASSYKFSKIES